MFDFGECVVYDFCGNLVEVLDMSMEYEIGDYFKSICAYTGREFHYIYLGKL